MGEIMPDGAVEQWIFLKKLLSQWVFCRKGISCISHTRLQPWMPAMTGMCFKIIQIERVGSGSRRKSYVNA
jgi:hypothetical protein